MHNHNANQALLFRPQSFVHGHRHRDTQDFFLFPLPPVPSSPPCSLAVGNGPVASLLPASLVPALFLPGPTSLWITLCREAKKE